MQLPKVALLALFPTSFAIPILFPSDTASPPQVKHQKRNLPFDLFRHGIETLAVLGGLKAGLGKLSAWSEQDLKKDIKLCLEKSEVNAAHLNLPS